MMDAHNWTTLRTVDGVDVRIRRLGSGSGSDGSYHVNDRVELQIDNRDRRPDDSYHVVALGERWDVEIGGHEAPRIEPPVRDDWDAYRSIRIPNTVETGRQTVTIDGTDIGSIRVHNPDYPLPEPEPEQTAPDPPDPTGGSSGSSDNSDPEPSPTPDPSGSTDSGSIGGGSSGQSSGGGSSINSRTRAAVIAVMGVVAALIATR